MLRKIFSFFLFTIPAVVLFAQGFGTVKGIVKDSSGRGVDLVTVGVQEYPKYYTNTDSKGAFELRLPAHQKLTLVFSSLNIQVVRRTVTLNPNEVLTVNQPVNLKLNEIPATTINGKRTEAPIPSTMDIKNTPFLSSTNESFEKTLQFQGLGVHENNELSSAYNVRGGNFDENLVYVNDFEVYRPYLIRSGQQEGLSFINPDMVEGVKFSSGGFQAKYGDKMSSVLDVTYRRPDSLHGTAYGSLLGWGAHLEGSDKKRRFTFSLGARQRTSQYILKSLDTKGEYSPNFIDVQAYLTYTLSDKMQLDYIGNYSSNKYTFIPVDRQTDFGLLTDVKRLTIYFDGQEIDRYQNMMNGLSLTYKPKNDLQLKFLTSYYLDREKESYDLIGQYYLSEVQSDLGQQNFGQILYNLGVGGTQDWARNTLNTDIYYAGFKGSWFKNHHNVQWGVDYKHEVVHDQISEWTRLDSAGHSVPFNYSTSTNPTVIDSNIYYNTSKNQVELFSTLKSNFNLESNRISAYIQDSWKFGADSKFSFNYGARFEYWDVNKEPIVTPRMQFSYKPKGRKDIVLTAAAGLYYQPPFYREMRNDFTGVVNTSLKAQKSAHVVAGISYAFNAWGRPFNITSEAYYKYQWDLVPYQYDDVLIKYLGNNSAKGYAAGIDARLNGELVEGAESWVNISIMSTQQKINGAQYLTYYDSTGSQVLNNGQYEVSKVDTVRPGLFPRPTDQRVSVSLFFQDYVSKRFKFIKVHVALVFATGLPFGPPGQDFYKDVLRMPPYRRADIGFSGQLWNPEWAKKKNKFNQGLKGIWLSIEAFNVFGITNTVSYLWIRDINNNQYAVPNYLSSRRINAKLMLSF